MAADVFAEVPLAGLSFSNMSEAESPDTQPGALRAAATGCDRSTWPVRVGRVGEPEPKADVAHLTTSQRVSLCWEVTKQAWALTGAPLDESAFCRDSERLSRRGS